MLAAMGRSIRKRVVVVILLCTFAGGCRSHSSEPSLDSLYSSSTSELRKGQFANALALANRAIAHANERADAEAVSRFRLLQAEIALFRRDAVEARQLP